MGQERWEPYTLVAGENLDDVTPGTGDLFKAISIDDGIHSANGAEAGGILQYGGQSGEHVTIGYMGVMKFTAGGAITAGDRMVVTNSGYILTQQSGSHVVGRCGRTDVASGEVGVGIFNFLTPDFLETESSFNIDFGNFEEMTTQNDLSGIARGFGVDINGGDIAAAGAPCKGVLLTGVASGDAAMVQVAGKVEMRAGNVILQGQEVRCAASGWFVAAVADDYVFARAIDASAAGGSGGLFTGVVNMHFIGSGQVTDIFSE